MVRRQRHTKLLLQRIRSKDGGTTGGCKKFSGHHLGNGTRREKKALRVIERGKAYLKGKIGQCNFEEETPEKDLLLNYCMYARAGQVDEFVKNYKQEIIALQIHNWRKKNAET